MSGERQIEMTWRCGTCSTRNLGRFKKCQSCGKPKDESEQYEMPEDTSKAATVTEAGLLRMALAGPDWRCAYCGSDQRRSDKSCANCGASALEGSEATDEKPPPRPQALPAPPRPMPTSSSRTLPIVLAALGGGLMLLCLLSGSVVWLRNRPHDYQATVSDVRWERVIDVERWAARDREGFKETLPADALNVKSAGQKVHHHEQVFDHYETEHYTVEVPDGYRSESYTERVSCGQDCTERPQSCREVCTSNKNGFASCRQVCSGGGRSCSTRYCNETRTRQIPKTRTESRSRQVSRYRDEPRYAESFTYVHWEWAHQRTARVTGTDVTVRWPEAGVGDGLAPGEKERDQRTESYAVTLTYGDTQEHTLSLKPATAEAFAKYAPGTRHALHTEKGRFQLDGEYVEPGGQ